MNAASAGLLFAVLSSGGWIAFDVLRKLLVRRVDTAALVVLLNLGSLPLFLALSSFEGPATLSQRYLFYASGSVAINVVANVLFLEAVRLSPLSQTIPLLGLTPVFTALSGWVVLAEQPAPIQWAGIALVTIGALTLNADARDFRVPWRLVLTLSRQRASLYMVLVALSWSVTPVFDKVCMRDVGAMLHAAVLCGGVAVGTAVWLLLLGRLKSLRRVTERVGLFTIAVISSVAALGFQLLSIQTLLVSRFEAFKRALGMMASVLLGKVVFQERPPLVRWLSVAVMSVGVLLLVPGQE